MNKLAVIAGACLLLAGSATARLSADEPTPSTADFIREVAISDMFEIEAGKLAEQKGDAATSAFGSHMITDHTKTTEQLKSLIQSGNIGVTPPATLDASHQRVLDQLKEERGSEFAKHYHASQVSAHKAAMALFASYAKDGENPALKSWAAKTLPTLEQHLQMAEALD